MCNIWRHNAPINVAEAGLLTRCELVRRTATLEELCSVHAPQVNIYSISRYIYMSPYLHMTGLLHESIFHVGVTTAHSELRAGINIWIKDWIFSYHLLQRKLNFIASPQLYAALNSYTSVMVGRGEVSLFSGIHSACVACIYNCVVRSTANTVDVIQNILGEQRTTQLFLVKVSGTKFVLLHYIS